MSYFEGPSPRWAQHGRQQSWETSQPSPRPGLPHPHLDRVQNTSDPFEEQHQAPLPEHRNAFGAQFDEVQRAADNLAKGSRMVSNTQHGRRGSAPYPGSFARQYAEFDPRFGGSQRHYSVGGDFEGRAGSSHGPGSVQGYLANQRFGSGPGSHGSHTAQHSHRGNEAEQVLQAKRRAAAQRERELRNYHQEQQYNRNASGGKSDRSMSPSTMSEDDRRELIARQHRALYGNESSLYTGDGGSPRAGQDPRALSAGPGQRGASPLVFEGYNAPTGPTPDASLASAQSRSRSNSNASPAANQSQFAMYDSAQQGNPTSTSSPAGGESPTRAGTKASIGGVAPIGTRPVKRGTPPHPSPLSFGFNNEKAAGIGDRAQSAASNPTTTSAERPSGLGWGSGSNQAPWGSSSKVQAPVWG